MPHPNWNQYTTTRHRGRLWGWMTVGAVVIFLVVGVVYSTGEWGEGATRTGGSAPIAQVSPGAGPNAPGVPNTR